MTERIALNHRIEHRFARRVQLSTHWLRLRPAPHAKGIEAYSLKPDAEPHFLNWLRDPYQNQLARLDLPEPLVRLGVDVEVIARLDPINPFDFLIEPYAVRCPFEYPAQLRKELAPYLRTEPPRPRLRDWLCGLKKLEGSVVDRLGDLARMIHERIPSTGGYRPGWVDVDAVLRRAQGSSWETAWLLTLSLRSLGLAARFTSGYRVWLSDTAEIPDAAAAHAWSEVFVPGAGWVGLDPSSGLFCGEGYIPVASAPDPLGALPVSGYVEACDEQRSEAVSVRRLVPAVAKWPLDDSACSAIRALGRQIDAELETQGVRLSLGACVSFTSTENPDAAEWNNAAAGPDKRQRGELLLTGLAGRLAPGGVLQLGQGEWYRGEELPRWRLGCFFRTDGRPIWSRPELSGWRRRPDLRIRHDEVRAFAENLARALRIPPKFLLPAFEDGLYQLWSSGFDIDGTLRAEDLVDPDRRRALAASLSARNGAPAGYVLPLRWDSVRRCWGSGAWTFRRGGLFLMPGKSPLGFRLPIDSLPVGDAGPADQDPERCQTEERELLPEFCGELSARYTVVAATADTAEEADGPAPEHRPPRTALTVELRDGQLYVFLPPLTHLEHYLDLIEAVQAAASETRIPVLLEGYEPPEDYRLQRMLVEPEPGILKVWLPEVGNWQSQRALFEAVYGEADRLGLRAERVLEDGRRCGPGGGGELVLGGRNPSDSPFLRSPALLRSLILYWQRHPSLSFLFAGRLIGPDGPAPRPDEGRPDALYELSLALDRIPAQERTQPWIPDRLLRHLLADPAGDMKRAEIRMDLLYAPDRPSLRLGKTVLRPFETAPDPDLAALQSLLVMAMVAALRRKPLQARPIDWGADLHDRFMLPAVLWDDFCGVLGEIDEAGLPLQPEWFQPIVDLRFPVLGRSRTGEIELELRSAHEPWRLLAEEATVGGIARFLDSSCERVQVRCFGLTPSRHVLSCNGFHVPLHETGTPGEFVAGIRYKVCNPHSALHPTIPITRSLQLDLIDTWAGRVVGGCTYIPPRPAVTDAAVSARVKTVTPPILRPDPERLRSVLVPPRRVGGRFSNFGSAPPNSRWLAPLPAESMQSGNSYLLDLARQL